MKLLDYRMKAALRAVGYDLLDTLKIWAQVALAAAIVFAVVIGCVALVSELGVGALLIIFALGCAIATATFSGVEAYKRGW